MCVIVKCVSVGVWEYMYEYISASDYLWVNIRECMIFRVYVSFYEWVCKYECLCVWKCMYLSVYLWEYVIEFVCVWVWICENMLVFIFVIVYICESMYDCVWENVCAWLHMWTSVCDCISMNISIWVFMCMRVWKRLFIRVSVYLWLCMFECVDVDCTYMRVSICEYNRVCWCIFLWIYLSENIYVRGYTRDCIYECMCVRVYV